MHANRHTDRHVQPTIGTFASLVAKYEHINVLHSLIGGSALEVLNIDALHTHSLRAMRTSKHAVRTNWKLSLIHI